ncbi:D-alanyl-lipoteichoic acid biosynthesis protein DltD [Sediminibacillus albus]|uniref:DltD C-terminal region n=1 Tax=Sediminibacillus albus TaxID=407036 RepID=A0A1G8YPT1_9BACI|nr:D-alanyl-lipoteichoic acid biosynthesis protein DltD [Sediminibacillus albus]SDK04105.1 DltD C-terminal region [Sediminibacillus albus]
MNIIIFGSGSSAEKIRRVINKHKVKIIAYADNNKDKVGSRIKDIPVISPSELKSKEYDYILIGSIYFEEIREQLLKIGIPEEKILEYYKYHNFISLQTKLEKYSEDFSEYNCLITGMSYAKYGLDLKELNRKAFNFALNSQDLFHDYSIVKYLSNRNQLASIKTIIVGLANYSLEFELIKSREKHLVTRYHPIEEKLKDDKDYYKTYKDLRTVFADDKFMNKVPHLQTLLDTILIDNYIEHIDSFEDQYKKDNNIAQLERKRLALRHSNKNYPKTVEKNAQILEQYLNLLKEEEIKPIIVILPQHKDYTTYFSKTIRENITDYLKQLNKDHSFDLIDLFDSDVVSDRDFFDVHHLNQSGAYKVTQLINKLI